MAPTTRTPRRPHNHRTAALAALAAMTLVSGACGGGSADTPRPSNDAEALDAAPIETTLPPPEPRTTEPPNPPATETTSSTTPTTSPTTTPTTSPASSTAPEGDDVMTRGNTPFDGPAFTDLATARMDELAVAFGLPVTSESLAPVFVLPGDFPFPDGMVVGVFHEFDLDQRYDDEIWIEEERTVGIAGPGGPTTLDAISLTIEADTSTRWQRASSQRDSFNNDLYTALPVDGGELKDRLVIRAVEEPDPGAPVLQLTLEQRPTEIPVPTWKAGLPTLDGGLLTNVREGRGTVEAFGRVPEDGFIEMREYYEIDRFDELEAFFASGIIESAGFTYEDTPFSNFSIRIDVSNDEWAGTVGVGEITIDGELFGYQLVWTLIRPA